MSEGQFAKIKIVNYELHNMSVYYSEILHMQEI